MASSTILAALAFSTPIADIAVASATGAPLSCLGSDATYYTYQQHTFQIACFNDSMYCDIYPYPLTAPTLESCIHQCITVPDCIDISYKPSCNDCWLKREVNSGTYNQEVWGARLVGVGGPSGWGVHGLSTSTSVSASGSGSYSGFRTKTRTRSRVTAVVSVSKSGSASGSVTASSAATESASTKVNAVGAAPRPTATPSGL